MKRGAAALALLVAACATPAEKITARLEAAGIPHRQSACMGTRLAERLSLGQLDELSRLVKTTAGEKLTVNRLVARLGDADPALVSELVRTGIGCAI